ncbi:MAG: DUF374 domain-containing protein [Betaproteobacteria bacterium]|nr:DUF374 domain-containing protein [Betaproteobacteria bacterium]
MNLLVSLVLEMYWFLLRLTIRPLIQGLDAIDGELSDGKIPVFAVAHHTILLSALAYRGRPATLLASLSKDGELAAGFLRKRGFKLVRGSSSRGGKEALENLLSAIAQGNPIAITFDGPRGPRLKPKAGIAVCGWHTSGSIFFLKHTLEPSRWFPRGICVHLKSWDRFILPLPGCRWRTEFVRIELPEKTTHSREEWVDCALNSIAEHARSAYAEY